MAQAPVGHKAVYLTSKVDAKLTIVPETAAAGSNIRVFVPLPTIIEDAIPTLSKSSQTLANTAVKVETCDATSASQIWKVMTGGRIALQAPSLASVNK
jgi:hypothetical protein